ncbi:PhzF family phenazine biosynthesis protein [Isachenkonia alkalipeptolytica]|uniref:PhzF family phenazine biosynthesis protein n=1 Tax=Isachenkonia alkalipeptolytica TaxID=2565777 RepID=A0AA43XJ54_9CLOT|nr:PhzF family phenazine biosynthesis protein [Isachenkonia alkalipeptolytica]NBG87805.1 PhzF family phenazine biosynthesis protein [Isachenkonia alkalipeptolytica]
MKYYVVDAFSENIFGGNPAGVCILEEPIEKELMQQIAAENNLSETAFVFEVADGYELKWFTPTAEVDLCGHATLATAHIIATKIHPDVKRMKFNTLSGILEVEKQGELYRMNFPSRKPKLAMWTNDMEAALGIKQGKAYLSRDLVIPLENEKMVKEVRPDFKKLAMLDHGMGVIVTAKGEDVDFVSRCFYPKIGVDEDPVTGSAHAALTPYWSEVLNKKVMVAKQLSKRGGTVYCEDQGERVVVSGKASTYLEGEIIL